MDDEMIEIYLPSNNYVNEFSSKKNSEKLKIIELGLSLFNSGKDIIQFWNNDEWESKIKSLETQIKTKESQFNEEKTHIISKTRLEEEGKYTSKISSLNTYIQDLEKRQKDSVEQLQSVYSTLDEKYEQRTVERIKG